MQMTNGQNNGQGRRPGSRPSGGLGKSSGLGGGATTNQVSNNQRRTTNQVSNNQRRTTNPQVNIPSNQQLPRTTSQQVSSGNLGRLAVTVDGVSKTKEISKVAPLIKRIILRESDAHSREMVNIICLSKDNQYVCNLGSVPANDLTILDISGNVRGIATKEQDVFVQGRVRNANAQRAIINGKCYNFWSDRNAVHAGGNENTVRTVEDTMYTKMLATFKKGNRNNHTINISGLDLDYVDIQSEYADIGLLVRSSCVVEECSTMLKLYVKGNVLRVHTEQEVLLTKSHEKLVRALFSDDF